MRKLYTMTARALCAVSASVAILCTASAVATPKKAAVVTTTAAPKGCPGTDFPRLDCSAIAAEASVMQAREASSATTLFECELLVSFLALCAAGAAATFAWSASRAAHDSNRPWLEFSEGVKRPFRVSINCAEFELEINLFNRGKSPATNVVVLTELLAVNPSVGDITASAEAKRKLISCLKAADKRRVAIGVTIFPKEMATPGKASAKIDAGAISAARGNPPGQARFYVAIGVRYRLGRSNRFGYTVNVYALHLSTGDVDYAEGQTTSVLPNQWELVDRWIGSAD